ncbi:MAG: T9SS type A sorting domain-containing protein, partial [Bacteroidota bacterium]
EEDFEDEIELRIGPNPVEDELNVFFDLTNATQVHIQLLDLQGKKVRSQRAGLLHAGSHQLLQAMTDLPAGVYFLHISVGDESIVKKIQKWSAY